MLFEVEQLAAAAAAAAAAVPAAEPLAPEVQRGMHYELSAVKAWRLSKPLSIRIARLGGIFCPRHSRVANPISFWQIRRTLCTFTSKKLRGFAKTIFCFGKSGGANDAVIRFHQDHKLALLNAKYPVDTLHRVKTRLL